MLVATPEIAQEILFAELTASPAPTVSTCIHRWNRSETDSKACGNGLASFCAMHTRELLRNLDRAASR